MEGLLFLKRIGQIAWLLLGVAHGWVSPFAASPLDRSLLLSPVAATHGQNDLSSLSPRANILLERMIAYFESMVDSESHRFFLLSHPQSLESPRFHVHCPLRDLGSAWDASKALQILRKNYNSESKKLVDAVLQTTEHYSFSQQDSGYAMHLSPDSLGEAPNIAHNALLLLTLVESEDLVLGAEHHSNDKVSRIDRLTMGILELQRPNGAFGTHFFQNNNDDDVSIGIAFFPGEAMTALMEVYLRSRSLHLVSEETLQLILPAMLRALAFYRGYYEEGRRENTINVNYAIWQIQAFCRFITALRQTATSSSTQGQEKLAVLKDATQYCLVMCHDILESPAWKLLSRGRSFFPNLSTVEIACGLDALCQGYLVLEEDCENDKEFFVRQIHEAVDFLEWSQDQVPRDAAFGYGGLGHGGCYVTEQRLDVTGHALSALANLVA